MATPKLAKKIAIASSILLVGFLVAGFIYVYYNDRSSANANQTKKVEAQQYQPVKPPPKPGPNAQVGVAEESFDSPVTPGSNSSIIINTTAGASCTISLTYNGIKSTDPALNPKAADAFGVVTWSWFVPQNTPYGNYPLKVTCRLGKNWAVYDDNLVVKD